MESVMQHSTFARKLKRRHRHLSIWLEYTRESKTSTRSEEFERRRSPIQPNNTDFAEQETPKPAWTYGTNITRMHYTEQNELRDSERNEKARSRRAAGHS